MRILTCLALATLSTAAMAQDGMDMPGAPTGSPGGHSWGHGRRHGQERGPGQSGQYHSSQHVFIAPSGEPFRSPPDAAPPVTIWFAGADLNHDGKLDRAEFQRDFLRFFDTLDTDHDGRLNLAEIGHYEDDIAPETHFQPQYGGGGGGQGSGDDDGGGDSAPKGPSYGQVLRGAARFSFMALPEPVSAMDENMNGTVSREEAISVAASRFSDLDTNHLGYLTLDGLPQTSGQKMRGRGDGRKKGD